MRNYLYLAVGCPLLHSFGLSAGRQMQSIECRDSGEFARPFCDGLMCGTGLKERGSHQAVQSELTVRG